MTGPKIKILDCSDLRDELLRTAWTLKQDDLAEWAFALAEHVLNRFEALSVNEIILAQGGQLDFLWQREKASVHQLRHASFAIHALARARKDEASRAAIRALGHALAVPHVREHAMIASDYAIKTVQCASGKDRQCIRDERIWQRDEINKYLT